MEGKNSKLRHFRKLWPRSSLGRAILLATVLGVCVCSYNFVKLGYSLFHWQAHIWAVQYWTLQNPDREIEDSGKHLIFVMVDHYEHGKGEDAAARNIEWCNKFRAVSERNRDDYGNRFRYTWFYPFDHGNTAIMEELSRMAYEGYGEIEMHWHLSAKSGTNSENYAEMVRKAIAWYQRFGALTTVDSPPKTAFAYIAGNWDLDASLPGEMSHGVTNQISVLAQEGCYADFTFSTIGTAAQPAKVNSIYYVSDDPDNPKSHNTGTDSKVGYPVRDKLLIFQGPISISWNGALEYGAIESNPRFTPGRVKKWIGANIHVRGRPEWIFVKVFSHGAQSSSIVLDGDMEYMILSLKKECSMRGIKVHFMSAREAVNVVRAAEEGKTGNPEEYRDYSISKYRNMLVSVHPR